MHLVVNSYGSKVLVHSGRLLVRTPEKRKTYPIKKLRSVTLHKGVVLSTDAALLCIENGVDVLFFSRAQKPEGRIWSHRFGSVSTIRRRQIEYATGRDALEWVKETLAEKARCQAAVLIALDEALMSDQEKAENEEKLEAAARKVEAVEAERIEEAAQTLRGLEGQASRHYFQALGKALPAPFTFRNRSRRPAQDMFNALLNYSYGILYARVEGALIRAGLDPYVGIHHRDEHNRPSLAFDVIEAFRHWADYVCVHLVLQRPFGPESFLVEEDGGHWVEGYAKKMLAMAFQDYFDEVVNWRGHQRTRENHIYLYAHELATRIRQGGALQRRKDRRKAEGKSGQDQQGGPEEPSDGQELPF